ncbi:MULTISPECIES: acyl-CoA dehydrogenase family protein [unclassified Chelatococcus]|uniref:acyl-CoA dehydrogenase family protein n=1 Tax=unclassified Chelatococcus TaxID=2638111 RepID=UPI001BD0C9A8|nr:MULTISPECIES: acyl-CoA dehydrogenase family protein [unclassified Chelatococcus]MBS7700225.1 hypothetical protein [Chelatococcus sp. YT9]MBX3558196.1 hypothetical protein [Chelatococcus sp.]
MTETARLLEDLADRLFSRALADPAARHDTKLAARLRAEAEGAGLPLALVAEADGGMGGTLEETCVIAWRAGYHAAPLPIVPMLLLPTLSGAAPEATLAAPGQREAPGPASLLITPEADHLTIFRAAPGSEGLDGSPWVSATGAEIERILLPGVGQRLAVQGACLTAATMLGAMARVMEITIEYANTRKQFGKPLSKFQALQHMIAEAASDYVVAQAALGGAVQAADGGWLRSILWQSAKVQAGRAATVVAAAGHQVLGAIGFTEEHVLHHYTRRLWLWRDDWGRQATLAAAVGQAAAEDASGLWSHLVDD